MHDPGPYYAEPEREERPGRDPMGLILAAVAGALALIAIVVAIIALTQDDEATVPSDFRVASENLADESVTEAKLAAEAVTGEKLAGGSVTLDKLAEDALAGGNGEPVALAEGSVTSDALAADAVRRGNIRDGVVNEAKLADGAVTAPKLAEGAVTSVAVADDGLTGDDIDEETLGAVPLAQSATVAETAMSIEGFDPGSIGLTFDVATAVSANEPGSVKGPVEATCPAGSQAVGGGAAIVSDAAVPVALIRSTRGSASSWVASARAWAESDEPWELEVTVVCATTAQ